MSQRSTVMIVFGGQSVEHGVSCLTAAGVIGAIDRSRFDIQGVGIATDGSWHQCRWRPSRAGHGRRHLPQRRLDVPPRHRCVGATRCSWQR